MTKKQKKMLARILLSTGMLVLLNFLPVTGLIRMALYLGVYLLIGYDILRKAGKGIINGRVCASSIRLAQFAQSTSIL